MAALSLGSDPLNTGIGFVITLTGVPAYYLFIIWDKKPKWFRKIVGKPMVMWDSFGKLSVAQNPNLMDSTTVGFVSDSNAAFLCSQML